MLAVVPEDCATIAIGDGIVVFEANNWSLSNSTSVKVTISVESYGESDVALSATLVGLSCLSQQ